MQGKWNESGFRPSLCTYRLNRARRTSWGWWDDWDDTVLQTQNSKFEPWRSEAEHATSRSRRLPTILTRCNTSLGGHSRRNIEPMLGKCIVFAGKSVGWMVSRDVKIRIVTLTYLYSSCKLDETLINIYYYYILWPASHYIFKSTPIGEVQRFSFNENRPWCTCTD